MAILEVIKETGVVELPAPDIISVGDEIIWSSNTGRSSTGLMLGDVIAEKQTLSIKWGILMAKEQRKIKKNLEAGFFKLRVNIDGNPIELKRYRGVLTSEAIGQLDDGIYYFRSVTVDIIQQ